MLLMARYPEMPLLETGTSLAALKSLEPQKVIYKSQLMAGCSF